MYKYLSITENLKEMMVMLKSLPANTLVFDKKGNLVDLNRPAQQLLKISNVQEFYAVQDKFFPANDYIKTIIRELKRGNTVRNAKTLLKCADDCQAIVELCACMINGCQDLFLFQLFEISPTNDFNFGSFTSYSQGDDESSQSVDWVKNSKDVFVPLRKNKMKDYRIKRTVDSGSIQLTKYRKLTKLEELVNKLVSLNMSVAEIATVTNKTNLSIRIIIRRVSEKQKLNFRKEAELAIND